MSKKLYPFEDINDLVEQDLNHEDTFFKGGKGSGIKGHTTLEQRRAAFAPHKENPVHKLGTPEHKAHHEASKDQRAASSMSSAQKIARVEETVKRNKLKATNQMSQARSEATSKIGAKPTPADEGNRASKKEMELKNKIKNSSIYPDDYTLSSITKPKQK